MARTSSSLLTLRVRDEAVELDAVAWRNVALALHQPLLALAGQWVILTKVSLREFRGVVQLELSEGCDVVAVKNVPAEARRLLPDVCTVASLGSAELYARVYFKARVLEPGELRTTATGEGLRTVGLSDVDGRVAVRKAVGFEAAKVWHVLIERSLDPVVSEQRLVQPRRGDHEARKGQ